MEIFGQLAITTAAAATSATTTATAAPNASAFATAATAPLLCAGITTYSPLRHWNVQPGSQVAITGNAIKIASRTISVTTNGITP